MFNNEIVAVKVIDVLHLKREKRITSSYHTPARNFNALSYRKTANTEFRVRDKKIDAKDNSIALVPQNVSYQRLSSVEELYVIHFEIYGIPPDSIQVFYPQNYKNYEFLFEEIFNKWCEKRNGYRYKCNSILNEILYNINKDLTNSTYNLADHIAQIIEKNLSNSNFSLSSLPSEIGISESYIRKKFAEKFKMSPKEYQCQIRLEHAKFILQTGLFSVKETSERCGFTNEKYFSALFKKNFSISPSEYRKKQFQ